MSSTDQLNFSNNIINTKTIEGLIGLFEGDSTFEFWFANVASSAVSESDKENLRKNFPRTNYLREVVLKLCWSIPNPRVIANDKLGQARIKQLEEKVRLLLERRAWEGNKTFWAALPWWRAFVFVTGDLPVKLPVVDGKVQPVRMPAQNMKILMDPQVRKIIRGFEFSYMVGSNQFTDQGDETNEVVETIQPGSWTVVRNGKIEELPAPEADLLPVAHLAWEEREDAPRGLPIALRLADKLLQVYSVCLDRRLGNKMGSVPIYKLLNSQGTLPPLRPAAVVELKTEVPFAPADFAAVPSGYTDSNIRSEYVDALRELHEAAFLPFELDNNGGAVDKHSGKALMLLSRDQIKYREAYQLVEAAFIEDLVTKALRLEGEQLEPGDLVVQYDPANDPDPAVRRADAQFYWDAGLEQKALEVMGNEEDEAAQMVKEVEDKRAEALLNAGAAGEGEDLEDDPEDEAGKEDKVPAAKKMKPDA